MSLRSSILYCSGRPLLRFASTAQGGIYLIGLGYKLRSITPDHYTVSKI